MTLFKRLLNPASNPASNNRGMTLIEIMIVLAIIGGIMALLLPKLTGSIDKANVKQTRIKMAQVVTALQMYYSDCGKFPQSLEGLKTADASCSNWGPEPYMRDLKDAWKNDLVYELNGTEYSLKSLGHDGREGGSGNDKDITLDDLQ